MNKKICSRCKEEKDICEFYNVKSQINGKRPECKLCSNKLSKLYNQKNKEKINIIKQRYVDNNKEKVKKSKKEWFNKNPTYQNEWVVNKYKKDSLFRLANIMRSRTRLFFKSKNIKKKNDTFEIVGCTPEYLMEYIEKKFTDGMSWEIFGSHIHIDHIIPLSSAKTEEEIYKLCHYTNLQPLWAEDNLKKSNKIITNFPFSDVSHNDETSRVQQESIIIDHP
jgi:hypothetical protein